MSTDLKATLEQSRLAELGLMTATLTHELRQPLFAIRSLAQLAIANEAGDPQAYLESLVEQTMVLERIVEAVGAYSREDTGVMVPIDPNLPPQGCVDLVGHKAKQKGVSLEVELDDRATLAAGDPTAILQVLVNLTQNAVDASSRGQTVWIRSGMADGDVVFEVLDEGPGVPAAVQQQIFEPFFTTKGPKDGTGLGLYLARELALRCRGDLELLPSEKGAHFRLSLSPWMGG